MFVLPDIGRNFVNRPVIVFPRFGCISTFSFHFMPFSDSDIYCEIMDEKPAPPPGM